jgi:UDP-3-O-[3-hydroxymyristoyl] glucosamine N-acyltransferase LpxD
VIVLARPSSLGALVEEHGGTLDEGADRAMTVRTIGPSDRTGADLAPVLHDRGAAGLVSEAVLLVASAVAARVPAGRRWIHPRAEHVLSMLLIHAEEAASVRDETAVVEPGAVIFPGVRLGKRVVIGAGSVIGRPGFRFVDDARIPHRGGVVIEDDVEIGALCTIDAGVLSPTTIGRGSKLDAQVHVGHGVVIGARCRIAGQVGLAGSVIVEDDVWIGGQAGIADHCRIGRGARIAAKAGVIGDIDPGAVVAGYPAVARARWLRGHARLYRR